MTYIDCQFQLALARASYWHAMITSGAYKQRKTQRGTNETNPDGTIVWRDCTDEEKLESATATMWRHIEFANECAESIAERDERLSRERAP